MHRKIFKDVTLKNMDKALKILEENNCPDDIYDSVRDARDFYSDRSEDDNIEEEE